MTLSQFPTTEEIGASKFVEAAMRAAMTRHGFKEVSRHIVGERLIRQLFPIAGAGEITVDTARRYAIGKGRFNR